MRCIASCGFAAIATLVIVDAARGDVFLMPVGQQSLVFVTVGDPGNLPDTRYGGSFGAVGVSYKIGKYEVTTAQYCQFLNAVAATDTYGLYHEYMAPDPIHSAAAGIIRGGTEGGYTYGVSTSGSASGLDHSNYPVNYVSWGDAARFVNWVHNGQPIGPQGLGTTESGAYALAGAETTVALSAVTRSPGAKYWIATENEWYKAAYYKGGGTSAGYWDYATQSDVLPGNSLGATPNNANYFAPGSFDYPSPVDYLTNVGAFGASYGPYGTADQTANLAEWNETNVTALTRGVRGGYWGSDPPDLPASKQLSSDPVVEGLGLGFRIVTAVPEPGTVGVLVVGGVMLVRRGGRRCRRGRNC